MNITNLAIGISMVAVAAGILFYEANETLPAQVSAGTTVAKQQAPTEIQPNIAAKPEPWNPTTAATDEPLDFEEPVRQPPVLPVAQRTSLWRNRSSEAGYQEVPVEHIQADPLQIAALTEGSPIEVHIPQTGRTFNGVVETVSETVPGVSTVDIAFDGLNDIFHMQMHRGELETHGWVATPEGVFSVEINAATGQGKVISDAATIARWPLEHDMVHLVIEEPSAPSQSGM